MMYRLKDRDGKELSRSAAEAVMKGRCAIAISLYALILTILSIYSGSNSSEILNKTLTINDTWSFYQSKSIKQAISQASVDSMEDYLLERDVNPALQKRLEDKITRRKAEIARYESDPKSNEGKRELMEQAARLERERTLAKSKSFYFSVAAGLLQISIVLASTSILAVSMELLFASIGTCLLGLAMFSNGFLSWML